MHSRACQDCKKFCYNSSPMCLCVFVAQLACVSATTVLLQLCHHQHRLMCGRPQG